MKQTLKSWYSQNQLTNQKYYQLVDLVDSREEYTLAELTLLASLPKTDSLPNPQPNELAKYQRQRNLWVYEEKLADWLDEPQSVWFGRKQYLIALFLFLFFLILLK